MALFDTARIDFAADRRVPFVKEIELDCGLDLTGCDFRMQVRDRKDGGFVRADLLTVTTAAAEGVRLISVTVVDGRPINTIGVRINETTMKAMAVAAEAGDDGKVWWDMHLTPTGVLKFVAFAGQLTVVAGVTE